VRAPRILLSAGEPSGDLHGAAVAESLLRRWPDATLYGLGGPRMERAGVDLLVGLDRLAVLGFAEVVRHLPFFLRLLRRMERELRERPPDLVIPIDYPGFNLRLAGKAKRRGVPVLYYVAPQVWAWHRSRVLQLARDTDRLAVILPFEAELFREAGANAHFVGHPLLDRPVEARDRATFAASLGVDPAAPILALFPGSRVQEVRRHLTLFARAAAVVRARGEAVQPVIAAAGAVPAEAYAAAKLPRTDDTASLLRHARAALVKSGTSTLQAALAVTPLVVAYRMSPLSYVIARRVIEVPHIGLVNLVAGERVAPELIQEQATPDALADALLPLLRAGERRDWTLDRLRGVRAALGGGAHAGSAPLAESGGSARPGAAERVAQLAAELLDPS
jgi:lipid-A-disaccharide synthase